MKAKSGWTLYAVAALVVIFAAAYFGLTFDKTLNLSDEGYLLYNFNKVAGGQLPHRDFYDNYGPASYWVGGALFKIFGTRIIVIRVFLVALKTAMALLVFLIGRRMLTASFAVIGSMLFTLNWGDPLIGPVNVLYAGHFNHFLALLGMYFILRYVDSEKRRWLFATGTCVGLSMLFKFPPATIDFLGFALFLSLKEHNESSTASTTTAATCPQTTVLQFLRSLKLFGIAGVGLFYLVYLTRGNITLYTFFLFLLAIFCFFGQMIVYESKAWKDIRQETRLSHWTSLRSVYTELAIMMTAPAVLVVAVVVLYAVSGGLPELIYDTFVLPRHLKFHRPMPDQRILATLTAIAVGATLLVVGIGKKLKGRKEIERAVFATAVSLAPALLLIAGFSAGVSYRLSHRLADFVILPSALLVGGYLFLAKRQERRRASDGASGILGLGLIFIFACQSSLMIFLRADETHVVLNSTVIFILIAFILKKLHEALRGLLPGRNAVPATVSVLSCLACALVPSVWGMKIFYLPTRAQGIHAAKEEGQAQPYSILRPDSPRARGLRLTISDSNTPPLHHPIFLDMNDVVNFLRKQTSSQDRIFLMCGDQIIYFLSERESALQKENYFVYLSNVELIDRTDTGRVSDNEILAALASAMPKYIIRTPGYGETVHFSLTWPKTNEFIRNRYEVDTVFGEYEILRPRGAP